MIQNTVLSISSIFELAINQFFWGVVAYIILFSSSICLIITSADGRTKRIRRTRKSIGFTFAIISLVAIWVFGDLFSTVPASEKLSEMIIWLGSFIFAIITELKLFFFK